LTTNPSADDKRLRLLIPLLVMLGVATLVHSRRRQQVWVWLHVLVGVLLVATGGNEGVDSAERFAGAGSNTIGAGRASGVAVVVLGALLLSQALKKLWPNVAAAAVIAWLAVALLSTGSRGPVFACAASLLLVAVMVPGGGRAFRVAAAAGALFFGRLVFTDATGLGANRLSQTLSGQYDLLDSRKEIWLEALSAIPNYPLGVGWGNFFSVLSPGARLASGYDQYPHNLLLEVFVEAGWLVGTAVLILLVMTLGRLPKIAVDPYGAALCGIALFFILNAMVSGDVNDNRMMWAAVVSVWVAGQRAQSPTPTPRLVARSSHHNHQRRMITAGRIRER
jgi:O-antigen ligase